MLPDDDEDFGGDDTPPPEDDTSWMDAEALARGYEEHLEAFGGDPGLVAPGEEDVASAEDGEGGDSNTPEDISAVPEEEATAEVPGDLAGEWKGAPESVAVPEAQALPSEAALPPEPPEVSRPAPEPRNEAPKPKATVLEISSEGINPDPVRQRDSAESQAAMLQKLRRGVVHIAIGMTGRPPKMNSFAMGAFQPGSTGQVPVGKAPETGRVEAPHDAEDRLVAHKDEAPARTVKQPLLKEEPLDFRIGPEDVDGLFGPLKAEPIVAQPAQPPAPAPVATEAPKAKVAELAPARPVASQTPVPVVPNRATPRGEDQISPESPRKAGAPKPLAKERSGKFGLFELLAVGMLGALVAALVVRIGGNGGGEKDGVETLAMGERQVVGLYLDNQLAGIERRITELEGEIHKEAVTPNPKPEALSRMASLARERAGLLYLAEAVKYRRRVVQGGQKIDGGRNGGQ
jgi:hypothetical protein